MSRYFLLFFSFLYISLTQCLGIEREQRIRSLSTAVSLCCIDSFCMGVCVASLSGGIHENIKGLITAGFALITWPVCNYIVGGLCGQGLPNTKVLCGLCQITSSTGVKEARCVLCNPEEDDI